MPKSKPKRSRQHQNQNRSASRRQKATTSRSEATAIVRVAAPPERPWELDNEQLTILKNSVCKGASDLELQYCLTVARRYRLDPFRQQIWFIKRWDKNADNGHGGTGMHIWVPQVGIYGMAHIASRDHKDYGSFSLPEYGPPITIDVEGKKITGPEWCRVKAFKKGIAEPSYGEAWFQEYCPKKYENTLFWRNMGHRMIAKCAKAQAMREAYPDLGGLYIPEEMERMAEDYTPSGRQITDANGFSPSGQPVTYEAQRQVTRNLDDTAAHGHEPGSEKAKMAEAQLKRVEDADKELAAKKEPPKKEEAKLKFHLEIDHNSANGPIVRGDAGEVLPMLDKFIKTTWGADEFWHIRPQDVDTIHAASKELGFSVTEIAARVSSGTSSREQGEKGAVQGKAGTVSPARTTSAPAKTSDAKATSATRTSAATSTSPAEGPQIVAGIIEQATPQAGKSPRLYVLLRMETSKTAVAMTAWNTAHFPFLIAGKGQQCELLVKRNASKDGKAIFTNIVALRRIGVKEFDPEDGKTPVIQQKTREAGTAGNLFQP